jgi:hypothetical protein
VELEQLVERLAGSRLEAVMSHLLAKVAELLARRDTLVQELQHTLTMVLRQVEQCS